jgi:hypothetical protein
MTRHQRDEAGPILRARGASTATDAQQVVEELGAIDVGAQTIVTRKVRQDPGLG